MKDFLEITGKCIDLYDFSMNLNEKIAYVVDNLVQIIKFKYIGVFEFEQFSSEKFYKIVERGEKNFEVDKKIITKILITGEYVNKNGIQYFPIKDVFYIYGVLVIEPKEELNEEKIKFFGILTRFLSLFFKKEKLDKLFKEKLKAISYKQEKEIQKDESFKEFYSAKEFILRLFSVKGRNKIIKLFFIFLCYEFKIKKAIFFLKKENYIPWYGYEENEFNFISLNDGLKNFDKFSFKSSEFTKKVKKLPEISIPKVTNPFCLIKLKDIMDEFEFENLNLFPVMLRKKELGLILTDKVLKSSHYYKISLLCEILAGSLYFSKKINELKTTYEKLNKFEHVSLLELLGEIAHEIKNPIVSIAGFSGRILKSFDKLTKEKFLKYVKIINEEAIRLEKLLNDILIFSKSDKISLKPIDVVDVIKDCINYMKVEAEKRNIEIFFEFRNSANVFGNKNLLKQVFINLINNSIEAINKNGKIFIKIDRIDNNCRITIEDTGGGIPSEFINKIFEPFFTTKDFGTGLGLSISYRIIQQHGGNISVKNTDKGAKFTIILPCRG